MEKTTKEVLPHSGKLKADQGEYQTNDKKGYESALIAEGNSIDEFTCLGFIWGQTRAHCKANAELICKSVNGYEDFKQYCNYIQEKVNCGEIPFTYNEWVEDGKPKE